MRWMEILNRYPWPLYLMVGLLTGMFFGYRMLPKMMMRADTAVVTATQSAAQLETQRQVEEKLEASLVLMEAIEEAHVQLSVALAGTEWGNPSGVGRPRASVTLSLAGTDLSEEQLATITDQVVSGVTGLRPGHLDILDTAGRSLNRKAANNQESKEFWTNIAINVSKVLGILAMLITLRFIIRTIGKSIVGKGA